MFKIRFSRTVHKYYESLNDERLIRDIDKCLILLEKNPFSGKDIKKLKGEYKGYYRITTDGYRIIYRVEKDNLTVNVVSIAPRGGAYK